MHLTTGSANLAHDCDAGQVCKHPRYIDFLREFCARMTNKKYLHTKFSQMIVEIDSLLTFSNYQLSLSRLYFIHTALRDYVCCLFKTSNDLKMMKLYRARLNC